jgi:hypothetical protein
MACPSDFILETVAKMAITSGDSQKLLNRTGAGVAILMVLILGGGIAALAKIDVPPSNHDILLVLITAVASNVGNIINFFFGSSASAKAKDDALNTAVQTTAAIQQKSGVESEPDKTIPLASGDAVTVKAEGK